MTPELKSGNPLKQIQAIINFDFVKRSRAPEVIQKEYGYLKEHNYTKTYSSFLSECPDLKEYYQLFKSGSFNASPLGFSLLVILEEWGKYRQQGSEQKVKEVVSPRRKSTKLKRRSPVSEKHRRISPVSDKKQLKITPFYRPIKKSPQTIVIDSLEDTDDSLPESDEIISRRSRVKPINVTDNESSDNGSPHTSFPQFSEFSPEERNRQVKRRSDVQSPLKSCLQRSPKKPGHVHFKENSPNILLLGTKYRQNPLSQKEDNPKYPSLSNLLQVTIAASNKTANKQNNERNEAPVFAKLNENSQKGKSRNDRKQVETIDPPSFDNHDAESVHPLDETANDALNTKESDRTPKDACANSSAGISVKSSENSQVSTSDRTNKVSKHVEPTDSVAYHNNDTESICSSQSSEEIVNKAQNTKGNERTPENTVSNSSTESSVKLSENHKKCTPDRTGDGASSSSSGQTKLTTTQDDSSKLLAQNQDIVIPEHKTPHKTSPSQQKSLNLVTPVKLFQDDDTSCSTRSPRRKKPKTPRKRNKSVSPSGSVRETSTAEDKLPLFQQVLSDRRLHEKIAETCNIVSGQLKLSVSGSSTDGNKTAILITPPKTADHDELEQATASRSLEEILDLDTNYATDLLSENIDMSDPAFECLFKLFGTDKESFSERIRSENQKAEKETEKLTKDLEELERSITEEFGPVDGACPATSDTESHINTSQHYSQPSSPYVTQAVCNSPFTAGDRVNQCLNGEGVGQFTTLLRGHELGSSPAFSTPSRKSNYSHGQYVGSPASITTQPFSPYNAPSPVSLHSPRSQRSTETPNTPVAAKPGPFGHHNPNLHQTPSSKHNINTAFCQSTPQQTGQSSQAFCSPIVTAEIQAGSPILSQKEEPYTPQAKKRIFQSTDNTQTLTQTQVLSDGQIQGNQNLSDVGADNSQTHSQVVNSWVDNAVLQQSQDNVESANVTLTNENNNGEQNFSTSVSDQNIMLVNNYNPINNLQQNIMGSEHSNFNNFANDAGAIENIDYTKITTAECSTIVNTIGCISLPEPAEAEISPSPDKKGGKKKRATRRDKGTKRRKSGQDNGEAAAPVLKDLLGQQTIPPLSLDIQEPTTLLEQSFENQNLLVTSPNGQNSISVPILNCVDAISNSSAPFDNSFNSVSESDLDKSSCVSLLPESQATSALMKSIAAGNTAEILNHSKDIAKGMVVVKKKDEKLNKQQKKETKVAKHKQKADSQLNNEEFRPGPDEILIATPLNGKEVKPQKKKTNVQKEGKKQEKKKEKKEKRGADSKSKPGQSTGCEEIMCADPLSLKIGKKYRTLDLNKKTKEIQPKPLAQVVVVKTIGLPVLNVIPPALSEPVVKAIISTPPSSKQKIVDRSNNNLPSVRNLEFSPRTQSNNEQSESQQTTNKQCASTQVNNKGSESTQSSNKLSKSATSNRKQSESLQTNNKQNDSSKTNNKQSERLQTNNKSGESLQTNNKQNESTLLSNEQSESIQTNNKQRENLQTNSKQSESAQPNIKQMESSQSNNKQSESCIKQIETLKRNTDDSNPGNEKAIDMDSIASKSESNTSKTDLIASKTDLVASKTDLVASKTDLVASKTNSVASKTDLIASKTDLVASKTDLVASKTESVSTDSEEPVGRRCTRSSKPSTMERLNDKGMPETVTNTDTGCKSNNSSVSSPPTGHSHYRRRPKTGKDMRTIIKHLKSIEDEDDVFSEFSDNSVDSSVLGFKSPASQSVVSESELAEQTHTESGAEILKTGKDVIEVIGEMNKSTEKREVEKDIPYHSIAKSGEKKKAVNVIHGISVPESSKEVSPTRNCKAKMGKKGQGKTDSKQEKESKHRSSSNVKGKSDANKKCKIIIESESSDDDTPLSCLVSPEAGKDKKLDSNNEKITTPDKPTTEGDANCDSDKTPTKSPVSVFTTSPSDLTPSKEMWMEHVGLTPTKELMAMMDLESPDKIISPLLLSPLPNSPVSSNKGFRVPYTRSNFRSPFKSPSTRGTFAKKLFESSPNSKAKHDTDPAKKFTREKVDHMIKSLQDNNPEHSLVKLKSKDEVVKKNGKENIKNNKESETKTTSSKSDKHGDKSKKKSKCDGGKELSSSKTSDNKSKDGQARKGEKENVKSDKDKGIGSKNTSNKSDKSNMKDRNGSKSCDYKSKDEQSERYEKENVKNDNSKKDKSNSKLSVSNSEKEKNVKSKINSTKSSDRKGSDSKTSSNTQGKHGKRNSTKSNKESSDVKNDNHGKNVKDKGKKQAKTKNEQSNVYENEELIVENMQNSEDESKSVPTEVISNETNDEEKEQFETDAATAFLLMEMGSGAVNDLTDEYSVYPSHFVENTDHYIEKLCDSNEESVHQFRQTDQYYTEQNCDTDKTLTNTEIVDTNSDPMKVLDVQTEENFTCDSTTTHAEIQRNIDNTVHEQDKMHKQTPIDSDLNQQNSDNGKESWKSSESCVNDNTDQVTPNSAATKLSDNTVPQSAEVENTESDNTEVTDNTNVIQVEASEQYAKTGGTVENTSDMNFVTPSSSINDDPSKSGSRRHHHHHHRHSSGKKKKKKSKKRHREESLEGDNEDGPKKKRRKHDKHKEKHHKKHKKSSSKLSSINVEDALSQIYSSDATPAGSQNLATEPNVTNPDCPYRTPLPNGHHPALFGHSLLNKDGPLHQSTPVVNSNLARKGAFGSLFSPVSESSSVN